MRYTVVVIPDQEWVSVSVPAMPGCVSQGTTRDEALRNIREAIEGWVIVEAEQGRRPLIETPSLVSAAVEDALEIIEDMRAAGEVGTGRGYELELAAVEVREPAIA